MLKLDFKKLDVTEEQLADSQKKRVFGLQPGNHDLRIVSAEFTKMNDSDPTWAQFKLLLSTTGIKRGVREKDGKSITVALDKAGNECPSKVHTVMVPTKTVRFNKQGITDNGAMYPFLNFRKFMAALGEAAECDPKVLAKIITKYFQNPTALEGEIINATIGYTKVHIAKSEEGYQIVAADGKPIDATEYPDRKAATIAAAEQGKTLQDWPEITEFYPRKEEAAAEEGAVYDPFAS